MEKEYCSKCGRELVYKIKTGKQLQIEYPYDTNTGELKMYKVWECPKFSSNTFMAMFTESLFHDYNKKLIIK